MLPALVRITGNRVLLPPIGGLYAFFPVFYSGAARLRTSPLRVGKKFHLYLLSRAIVIREQRYSGDIPKMRCLRGEAVTAPALADKIIIQTAFIKRNEPPAQKSRRRLKGSRGTSPQGFEVQLGNFRDATRPTSSSAMPFQLLTFRPYSLKPPTHETSPAWARSVFTVRSLQAAHRE